MKLLSNWPAEKQCKVTLPPDRRTIDFSIEEWREFTGVVHIECTDFLQAAVVEHERTPGVELLATSVEIRL